MVDMVLIVLDVIENYESLFEQICINVQTIKLYPITIIVTPKS